MEILELCMHRQTGKYVSEIKKNFFRRGRGAEGERDTHREIKENARLVVVGAQSQQRHCFETAGGACPPTGLCVSMLSSHG